MRICIDTFSLQNHTGETIRETMKDGVLYDGKWTEYYSKLYFGYCYDRSCLILLACIETYDASHLASGVQSICEIELKRRDTAPIVTSLWA
jgi:hypothetical protein